MARGIASPAPNPLPKVSFVRVNDDISRQSTGVADQVARSYGYNGLFVFQQEKHYIRYIEPLESDLAVQVEYDMDEQDQEWVDALNADRKTQHLDKVSYETFEIVMDRLEKEWFDLTKNIPKTDIALPSEDSTCAICDDSEGENANAIVFCDGCNLAVHQDCYGVPYIPEGQWLCRKCTVSPENPVSCILCPNEGGAFKQTVSGDWVHLLCAIWVPETVVTNEVFMEPITGVDKISKQRWRLRCSICEEKQGACIQCTKPSCFTAFHATCARKEKLLMPMKATQGSEAPILACYCEKHLPLEQQKARDAARQNEPDEGDEVNGHVQPPKSSKSARAYNKTYKPGPPLVPRIIVNRIIQYISRIHIRHKPEFVHLVCRYWSLKREARRGAPLLKRLHLEPWTALSGSKQQTDQEKAAKLDLMKALRDELEKLHLVTELVRKRERVKQAQAEAIQDVLLHFLFPHEGPLRLAFQKITAHDRQHSYFKTPVNKTEVPDYYDVIKNPMWWDKIDQKLDMHEYLDLAEFKRDINLVLDNAIAYNEPPSTYHKAAMRIRNAAQVPLAELDKLVHRAAEPAPDVGRVASEKMEEVEGQPLQMDVPMPKIGDLEPPLEILDLLMSEESIRQDTNLILTTTPIESLFNFELPLIRPPPPPPPPFKRPSPESALQRELKRRRLAKEKEREEKERALEREKEEKLRALEREQGKEKEKEREVEREKEREAAREKGKEQEKGKKGRYDRGAALKRAREERQAALDASPGFRLTRTRAGAVASSAFEGQTSGTSAMPDRSLAGDNQAHASSSTNSPEKPKRQRKSLVPGQAMPVTVKDVDSWQSFKLFERGWILPADQKRRSRTMAERPPQPPAKKKTKTTGHKSQNVDASMESTGGEAMYTNPSAGADADEVAPAEPQDTTSADAPKAPSTEAPENSSESTQPPRGHTKSPISVHGPPLLSSPPSVPSHDQSELETVPPTRAVTAVKVVDAPLEVNDEDMEIDVVTVSSPGPALPQPEPNTLPVTAEAHCSLEASSVLKPPAVPEEAFNPEIVPTAEDTSVPTAEPNMVEPPSGSELKPTETQPHESQQLLTGSLEPPVEPSALESDPDATDDEFIDGSDPPIPPQPLDMTPPPEMRMRQEPNVERMDVDEPLHVEEPTVADVEQHRILDPVAPHVDTAESADVPASPPRSSQSTTIDDPTVDQPVIEGGPQEEHAPVQEETANVPKESQPQQEDEDDRRPRKVIWIDVLDTPAIRREKAKQKRLERDARKHGILEALFSDQPVAGPSRLNKIVNTDAMDLDSDLTDLTDLDENATEDDEPVPRPMFSARVSGAPVQDHEPPEPGMIVLGKGERVEGGTLVWAKTGPFPYWPAVVFEEDDPEVPPNVLATAPGGRDNSVALVRFYEKKSRGNWSWVKVRNMRYLGEDDGLDAAMLAPTSRYQKWRSAAKRAECRNAFQDALGEMEGDTEIPGNPPAAIEESSATIPFRPFTIKRRPGYSEMLAPEAALDAAIEAAMGADSPMTEVAADSPMTEVE